MTIKNLIQKIAPYVAAGIIAVSSAYAADTGTAPKAIKPILQKKTAEIKKEEPKQTAPATVTIVKKEGLEDVLGEMKNDYNGLEGNINNNQKESETLQSKKNNVINGYINKLDSYSDKLKETSNFFKGKIGTTNKTEVVQVYESPIGIAFGVGKNNNLDALSYFGDLNVGVVGVPLINRIGVELGYSNGSKSIDPVEITAPLGNGFTGYGKTETSKKINNFSLMGIIDTGFPVRECSIGLGIGAENNEITDTRTVTEKIFKNGNQMSYNSHQKVDGPRNETAIKGGLYLNINPSANFGISIGADFDKNSKLEGYKIKGGYNF